jgi:hypothetical protein
MTVALMKGSHSAELAKSVVIRGNSRQSLELAIAFSTVPPSGRRAPMTHFHSNAVATTSCLALAFIAGCARHDTRPARRVTDSTASRGTSGAGELARSETPPVVAPSPAAARELTLADGDTPIDLAVWPSGPEVAILLSDSRGSRVVGWKAGDVRTTPIADLPAGFVARAIATHPAYRTLFVSGRSGSKSQILSLTNDGSAWRSAVVFEAPNVMGRLIVGPRPFAADSIRYRLFFAAQLNDGSASVRSVTETGRMEYQVVGPAAGVVAFSSAVDNPPTQTVAPSATLMAVHPSGQPLIWQDGRGCAHLLEYSSANWHDEHATPATPCGGSVSITPNGIAYLSWRSGEPGISVTTHDGQPAVRAAAAYTFVAAPVSVPDGKGVIGVISKGGSRASIVFAPVTVPLADVANAWQLAGNACDQRLFSTDAGLFRAGEGGEQLYSLFDHFSYGGQDAAPPILVTTDLFWENFGAAFDGTFIVLERRKAIPAFWSFVDAAKAALSHSAPGSRWAKVFAAIAAVRQPNPTGEAAHILNDSTTLRSMALDTNFNFAELKARGHYTSTVEMTQYFRAMHYFTEINRQRLIGADSLASLPVDVQRKALDWIDVYRPFIAPSRAPLVWAEPSPSPVAAYAKHKEKGARVFPLSWGLDNETLESTVYHETWPPAERISGPHGMRQWALGEDVAEVYGSALTRTLLATDFADFPPLRPVMDGISARRPSVSDTSNLYDRWLDALGVEWADSSTFPGAPAASPVWPAKRLQTGLASWATIREATILVNERAAGSEGGEGGFEELIAEVPRGYVEPSPKTFEAIAKLFDALASRVNTSAGLGSPGDSLRADSAAPPLRDGILRRLRASAVEVRGFEHMAEKELRGEPLTDAEYEAIRAVGGSVEHAFLIYKSLANKDFAISKPEPLPKVADVAGDLEHGLLEVAVGEPLEWAQIVPFFGRREIALGSVYSYYEFHSGKPYDNQQWRKEIDTHPRPSWIVPLIAPPAKSCAAARR